MQTMDISGVSNKDRLTRWGGTLVGMALSVVVVYALLGALPKAVLQMLVMVLFLAVVAAYAIGLQSAKAHTRGLEHGVDVKMAAQKEQRSNRRPRADRSTYLPDVPTSAALIITQDDGTNEPIDM